MIQKYPLVAAAVAAALVCDLAAAQPALSQASAPAASLVIAGSSAAATGLKTAIQNDICGGAAQTLTVQSNATSSANKNFFAYSCTTAQDIPGNTGDTDVPKGTLVTIYYRTEGGSVVGALPIAANHTIQRLNLGDSSCTASGATGTCTVTGVTSTNGISDSWNGAVTADYVGLGVTDVEPAQLTGYDSPLSITTGNGDAPNAVAYKTTAFGNATPTQMSGLSTVALYQQVFALAVNTSGQSFSTVNLNRETASNILLGGISDWSKAIDAGTGSPISSVSSPISVIQREYGSGTRTTANIYFNQYCNGGGVAMKGTNAPLGLNYSTGDDLTQANSTAGSIAYAVIDQLEPNSTTYPNLVMVTLDGVTPSNLNAAVGKYDYWYEATFVPSSTLSGTSKTLADFLETDVPQLLKAPPDPADNVIPGYAGNSAVFPTPTNNGQTGTKEIYTSQYTRGGVSCNAPSEKY